jgi:hypothetical protein
VTEYEWKCRVLESCPMPVFGITRVKLLVHIVYGLFCYTLGLYYRMF